MQDLAPRYRIGTTQPVPRDLVCSSFEDVLHAPVERARDLWPCVDGSAIVLKDGGGSGLVYVEFQCQFHALPGDVVGFGLLGRVIAFCREHGGAIRLIRNNLTVSTPASVHSDVFWSRAYRVARHLAQHPNDAPAQARFVRARR